MAKTKFQKITRVVAGVSIVTATGIGCSDNATNSNVVYDCVFPSTAYQQVAKQMLTASNAERFINQYSNDLPTMREILLEFENDFYQASHNYFYVSEILSSRINILQDNYNFFPPLVRKAINQVELAMQEGLTSFKIELVTVEGNGEEDAFDWDNPPAVAPRVNTTATVDTDDPKYKYKWSKQICGGSCVMDDSFAI